MIRTSAEQGYVTILAILIVSAVSLAIAVTLLNTGSDSLKSALIEQRSTQARGLASACAEEALQTMHDTTTFTGTNSLSLGQGNCTYTVTNTGGSARTISATGTVGGVVRKVMVYATMNTTSITITSWQDAS